MLIRVRLTGDYNNLKNALVSACHHYSNARFLSAREVLLTYITETEDNEIAVGEVLDSIDIIMLESLGVDIEFVN